MKTLNLAVLAVVLSLSACDDGTHYSPDVPSPADMQALATSQASLAGATFYGTDNSPGVIATGDGEGYGVLGFGGSSSWFGVYGAGGGTDGSGVAGAGVGSGTGVAGVGGANGVGGHFRPGTASTPTERRAAIIAEGGDIHLTGPAPAPNVPIVNAITPSNVAKAWAVMSTNGPGTYNVSIFDGANIGPMMVAADSVEVNLAAPTGGQCAAIATSVNVPLLCRTSCNSGLVVIRCHKIMQNGTLATYNFGGEAPTAMSLVVFGSQ